MSCIFLPSLPVRASYEIVASDIIVFPPLLGVNGDFVRQGVWLTERLELVRQPQEGIGCASRTSFGFFCLFFFFLLLSLTTLGHHPPCIKHARPRRMQPYIHLNFLHFDFEFWENFSLVLLDLSGVRPCFWIGVAATPCPTLAELEIVQPGPAADQGPSPPGSPNVAKSDRHTVADLQKGAAIPLFV